MSNSAHIRNLFTSSGHNFIGHHGRDPDAHAVESHESVSCVAGKGIEGDRYYGHKENFKGQITFFDYGVYQQLLEKLNAPDCMPEDFRRNVIVEHLPLTSLIGRRFLLQGIEFEGVEECRPCYWMDRTVAEGAEDFLRGRGGLRAKILTSGTLTVGPADFHMMGNASTGKEV